MVRSRCPEDLNWVPYHTVPCGTIPYHFKTDRTICFTYKELGIICRRCLRTLASVSEYKENSLVSVFLQVYIYLLFTLNYTVNYIVSKHLRIFSQYIYIIFCPIFRLMYLKGFYVNSFMCDKRAI